MSSAAGRVWAVIKPHVPMIRFRKGGNISHTASTSGQSVSSSTSGSKKGSITQYASILPKRFGRKPMTAIEMEAIQYGGLKAL